MSKTLLEIQNMSKTLLEECEIIRIKSWKVDQAITMFNSLNSDGMPLTDSDIIYSKMFAAAKDDEERNTLGSKWKYLIDLTDQLEKKKIVNKDDAERVELQQILDRQFCKRTCDSGSDQTRLPV